MNGPILQQSGTWLFHPRCPHTTKECGISFFLVQDRLDVVLLLYGARRVLSRRLRVGGKTPLLPRGQWPERGHARGLTIQLSQGQGRQPLVPEGAPPARGRAALQSCSCTIVRKWHSTPSLCSCQPTKLFLF